MSNESQERRSTYSVVNDQGLVDMNGNEIVESASSTWYFGR